VTFFLFNYFRDYLKKMIQANSGPLLLIDLDTLVSQDDETWLVMMIYDHDYILLSINFIT